MINVTQTINREEQSVSWALDVSDPEHERHGRMCHAFDGGVMDDRLRHILRQLGYVVVCSEEHPFPQFGHTEYWARA